MADEKDNPTVTVEATVGDGLTNGVFGANNVQTTTTTTTHAAPSFQANPQIILPAPNLPPTNETVILYLMTQNQILAKMDNGLTAVVAKVDTQAKVTEDRAKAVEARLDERNVIWETQLKGLREVNLGLEATVGTMASKLKLLEETSASLEHMSKVRGNQNESMETKVTTLTAEVTKLTQEVKTMSDNPSTRGIDPKALMYAFILLLLLGGAFFLGLGFYFIGGG